jgi:hypothetical protein
MSRRVVLGYHPRTGEPLYSGDPFALEAAMRDVEAQRVALDEVDGWRVSTVHLVIDQSLGNGDPVLWETMVFGIDGQTSSVAGWESYTDRYTSREAAEAGHRAVVTAIRAGLPYWRERL